MRVVKRSSCISTGTALAEPLGEPRGERARLARLLGVARRSATAAGRRPRAPPRARARARAARRARACCAGRGDGLDRRDDRAGGVAQRAAAARAAVVEREHAHARSALAVRAACALAAELARISRRAPPRSPRARRRSPRRACSGSRPPACAIVSRPPPPPPTTSAATLTTAPAFTPRSTSSGATLATQVHAAVGGRAEQDRGVAERGP